ASGGRSLLNLVIPGPAVGRNPESRETPHAFLDSGFARLRVRPGMTGGPNQRIIRAVKSPQAAPISSGAEAETMMAGHHNARTDQKWAMAALLASLFICLTAAPALAQGVPLPTTRPAANTTGSIVPRADKPAIPPQALAARAQAQAPNPVSNPFAALLGKSGAAALKPEQRTIIDRVNNYLSSVQVLSGNFVQVGPDGGRTQGQFYIFKPGKVRFQYDDPSPIELVADGQSVVVRDRRLATQDVYPLSQTPLRFLLA